jgi:pyridoxamine 5'-phosphate oxidase
MSSVKKSYWTETLPEPLPANPLILVSQWLADAVAASGQPNPNAMVLATVDDRGRPSARVVLCKDLVTDPGFIVFYTNYHSRKGTELTRNPHAAAVFHWDAMHRQVRIEGAVELMSEADNDAYFDTRAWQSRLGAWASQQSQPVESRAVMAAAVAREAKRFGIAYGGPGTPEPDHVPVAIPRPPHWGGFRLRAEAVELWVEGEFRIHDRALWTRSAPTAAWAATRLQP